MLCKFSVKADKNPAAQLRKELVAVKTSHTRHQTFDMFRVVNMPFIATQIKNRL